MSLRDLVFSGVACALALCSAYALSQGTGSTGSTAAPAAPAATTPSPSITTPAFPAIPGLTTPATLPGVQPGAPAVQAPGSAIPGIVSPPAAAAPASPSAEAQAVTQPDLNQRNEFQDFIAQSLGRFLPMFGASLFSGVPSTFAPVDRIPVTPDYVVGPGDELVIRTWGQLDVDYRAVVDRNGAINIPRVGNINVAGIRYQELEGYVKNAISRNFRNFEINVTLGQLRSIQIFVVGQARRPGSYTVSSLSTLVNALFASGGPNPRGSMRKIQLKRGNKTITEFDLYDLLLKGDKSKDAALLPGDVIYIPPIGDLAAVSGSVNEPAIYELRGGASLGDLIQLAGGLTTTAAGQKATVERIEERKVRRVDEFALDKTGLARSIRDGDLVQIHALSPRFDNAVTLRGSVASPARYPWRAGMRIRDIVPDRDALIVPDYWQRQNLASRVEVTGIQRLRVEIKRTYDEINWDYAVIERLNYEDLTTALIPFNLGRAILDQDPSHNLPLRAGDTVTVFSKGDIQVPIAKQTKYVRVEGEVVAPGIYQAMPGETLRQLVARIGGVTANAYLYGAEFTREATRAFQQRRLDESIDFLEREIQRTLSAAAGGAVATEDVAGARLQAEGQAKLIARLRQLKASGRIVLELPSQNPQLKDLPDIVLEDSDRFLIPSRPSTVSVVGSVYNQNAFLYRGDQRVSDYLARAGGPTKDADKQSTYVIRADGTVSSQRQSGWFLGSLAGERLMPGDTLVIPEDFERFRWTKELKDWTQILYQFALGVAGLKVLRDL